MNRLQTFFSSGLPVINLVYSTSTTGINVRSAALAAGWDGVSPVFVNVTVTSTGVIQSPSYGSYYYALDTGTFPSGSRVNLTIEPGGQIWGQGGPGGVGGGATASSASNGGNGWDGGNAIRAQCPISITNKGTIAGGGGGGGGGGGAFAFGVGGNPAAFASGGDGGRGQGYNSQLTGGGSGYTSNPVGGALASSGYGGSGNYAGMSGWPGASGSIGGTNGGGGSGAGGNSGIAGKAVEGGEYVTWLEYGDVRGNVTYTAGTTSHIATPASTPSVGAAFEGGYYTGNHVYQEVAQPVPMQLAIGVVVPPGISQQSNPAVTFTVPEMAGDPRFYPNQTLRVCSRADPSLYFSARVLAASGQNLTLYVNSVSKQGTASDWSIMGSYRIIQAPPAQGETTIALMGADVPMPEECITLVEGRRATQAMLAAGDATAFPAAHWVAGLTIGGKSDWYIPARDEDEGAWRFNKPVAVNNYVTTDRPVSARDYKRRGTANDTSAAHGVNTSAMSTRSAYTTTNPAQVAAGVSLRSGEANARAYPGATYLTASEFSDTQVWAQVYDSAAPGRQVAVSKTTPGRIRATRRSII